MALTRRSFVAGLAATLTGCGVAPPSSSARARVVSLSPSTTEAVFAVGAGALLVGRSRFCDYPAEAAALPVVGGFSDPNIEAVLALRPTLVVGAHGPAGPSLAETLGAHHIATYFPETESFEQIRAMLVGVGERLGQGAAARALAEHMEAQRAAIVAATASLPAPRALMLFDVGPIVVAGPGGFPDQLMRLAHARNLIVEGGAYPTIGLERLLALDPEVILDGVSAGLPGPSPLAARRQLAGWRSLQAFVNDRVVTVGSTVLRPGPRIVDGLRELARGIHGAALVLP